MKRGGDAPVHRVRGRKMPEMDSEVPEPTAWDLEGEMWECQAPMGEGRKVQEPLCLMLTCECSQKVEQGSLGCFLETDSYL